MLILFAAVGCAQGTPKVEREFQTAITTTLEEELSEQNGEMPPYEVSGNGYPDTNTSADSKEEQDLLTVMQTVAGHEMEDYEYVDLDHDGAEELIGVFLDEEGYHQAWYCSSDAKFCTLIHQNDESMDGCITRRLELDDETHVVINAYRMLGTGKNYSVFKLKNGRISCLVSNQYGYVHMNDEGDIILDVETYDAIYDPDIREMIGHTWKDTYLYFDGTAYYEYGATLISEEEFLTYENAQKVKDAIAETLTKGDTVELNYIYFMRKNGIMHIQCDTLDTYGTIRYGYYTIRYDGKKLKEELGEYTPGRMMPCFSHLEVTY